LLPVRSSCIGASSRRGGWLRTPAGCDQRFGRLPSWSIERRQIHHCAMLAHSLGAQTQSLNPSMEFSSNAIVPCTHLSLLAASAVYSPVLDFSPVFQLRRRLLLLYSALGVTRDGGTGEGDNLHGCPCPGRQLRSNGTQNLQPQASATHPLQINLEASS